MAKIIWIWTRMVIKPYEETNETSFWIILPEKKWEWRPQRWIILNFWEEAKKYWLKEWDEVLFREFSPTDIEIDWEKYLLLDIQDVLWKIEK